MRGGHRGSPLDSPRTTSHVMPSASAYSHEHQAGSSAQAMSSGASNTGSSAQGMGGVVGSGGVVGALNPQMGGASCGPNFVVPKLMHSLAAGGGGLSSSSSAQMNNNTGSTFAAGLYVNIGVPGVNVMNNNLLNMGRGHLVGGSAAQNQQQQQQQQQFNLGWGAPQNPVLGGTSIVDVSKLGGSLRWLERRGSSIGRWRDHHSLGTVQSGIAGSSEFILTNTNVKIISILDRWMVDFFFVISNAN